jgi:hypothetical protein
LRVGISFGAEQQYYRVFIKTNLPANGITPITDRRLYVCTAPAIPAAPHILGTPIFTKRRKQPQTNRA